MLSNEVLCIFLFEVFFIIFLILQTPNNELQYFKYKDKELIIYRLDILYISFFLNFEI